MNKTIVVIASIITLSVIGLFDRDDAFAVTIPINFDGVDYLIEYATVNMDVYDMYIEKSYNSLILDVDVFDDVGILDITIERALLDSVLDGEDVEYIVIIDGTLEGDVIEWSSNEQLRTLSITVPSGSVNVEIIGTVLASDNTESVNTTQIEPIPPEPIKSTEPSISKKTNVKNTNHHEVTITPKDGSGTSGCQYNLDCNSPMVASVDVGGTVFFNNTDDVSHTYKSGTLLNPTDHFDTGLLQPGEYATWKPQRAEIVDYVCLVHPWRTGIINVIEQSIGELPNTPNNPPPDTSNTPQIESPIKPIEPERPEPTNKTKTYYGYNEHFNNTITLDCSDFTIDILGKVNEQHNTDVAVFVIAPNENYLAIDQLSPDRNNMFSMTVSLASFIDHLHGTPHTILMKHGSDSRNITHTYDWGFCNAEYDTEPTISIPPTNTEPTPTPTKPIADFVTNDPQTYVDRYNTEPTFKEWFDKYYIQYDSIYEAVGLPDPNKSVKTPTITKPTIPDPPPCPPNTKLIDGECLSTELQKNIQKLESQVDKLKDKVDTKTERKDLWKERYNICKDNKSTIKSELSDLQSEHLTLETKYNEAFFTIEKLKQELYEAQKRIEELESN